MGSNTGYTTEGLATAVVLKNVLDCPDFQRFIPSKLRGFLHVPLGGLAG